MPGIFVWDNISLKLKGLKKIMCFLGDQIFYCYQSGSVFKSENMSFLKSQKFRNQIFKLTKCQFGGSRQGFAHNLYRMNHRYGKS